MISAVKKIARMGELGKRAATVNSMSHTLLFISTLLSGFILLVKICINFYSARNLYGKYCHLISDDGKKLRYTIFYTIF